MKTAIVLLLASGLGLALLLARPDNASCRWCPTYTCYGSCGAGCVCITPPGKFGGQCYGVD